MALLAGGDFDYDAVIGAMDSTVFADALLASVVQTGGSSSPVPEPAALTPLASASLWLRRRR